MAYEETIKEKYGRLLQTEIISFFKHHDEMRESHYNQCVDIVEKMMER